MTIEVSPGSGFEEIVTNLSTAATPTEIAYEQDVQILGNVTENIGESWNAF